MRRHLIALALAGGLAGCWLVEPQYVRLTPEQEAAIVAAVGTLSDTNVEAWVSEASKVLNAEVTKIVETAQGTIIKLSPPGKEAGDEAAESMLDKIVENPTPAGIVAGLGAALLVVLQVLARRRKLEK